ncbi:pseudo response regulator [Selaginella moellendorffii]|uniref:Pseudo response regulator n=1 Tax=Selaginella moellendorffii TaxID=88036 RepID=D8RWN5_SELML|nr:pseudo response regulator [Selaginella moellendorffii]
MDLILGEVASHVSQKTHCGDDEDRFSSTRGLQDISHRAEYKDEERKEQNRSSSLGLHILLAEDTLVIQKVAVVLLKKLGATVVAVANGQAAVEAWKGSLKDQVVVDKERKPFNLILMMPRMDGYGATREIRKATEGSGSHVPIVALTTHMKERSLEMGINAYLTKPIDCKLILSLTKRRLYGPCQKIQSQ